jgi:hypothetical protein
MTLPRRSQQSLANQLELERSRLCVVTEGEEDRHIIDSLAAHRNLAVDCYQIGDIDAPIENRFHGYGDNKARVASLLASAFIREWADTRVIGFIDRDLDEILRQAIVVCGLYYSEFTCFSSRVFIGARLKEVVSNAFARSLDDACVEEIEMFSRKFFVLFTIKERFFKGKSLPSIDKSVRPLSKGGFDWAGYLNKVRSSLGWPIGADRIDRFLDRHIGGGDVRSCLKYHTSMSYFLAFGRAEGFIPKGVEIQELYRHMKVHFIYVEWGTEMELIEHKALALV